MGTVFLGARGARDQAKDISGKVATLVKRATGKRARGEPEFTITRNKKPFRFYKLSGGGRIGITYMGSTLYQFLNVLLLVVAVGVLIFLPHYEVAGRAHLIVSFGVGALLLSALSEALTPFMGTVFLGTLCSAVFWVGYYILVEIPPKLRAKAPPGRSGPAAPPPQAPPPPPPPSVRPKAPKTEPPAKRKASGRAPAKKSGRKPAKGQSGRAAKKGRG
jgi:hypothetical protein